MDQGGTALGLVCRSLSPVVIELIGLSGFDFVWVDMEHTCADFQTVENLCRAADAAGIETLVRVPDKNGASILKALEAGAGIVNVPQVENRDEARAVVKSAKFQPLGERGFCSSSRGTLYGFDGGAADGFAAANARTMTMVQIESAQGVANAREICSVAGLDAVFVGLADLSCSLGITAQFDHPELISNARKIVAAAAAAGKLCAVMTDTPEGAQKWVDEGARIVACGVDIPLVGRMFRNVREDFDTLKRR